MRISDWSSDVCSSDLLDDIEHVESLSLEQVSRSGRVLCVGQAHHLIGEFAVVAPTRDKIVIERLLLRRDDMPLIVIEQPGNRSEERRVGKECVSTCRSRWSP